MCVTHSLQFYYFSQAIQILPPGPATQIFWWKYFFFTFLSLLLPSPHTLMVCAVSPDPCKDRATLMGLLFTSVGTKILPNENICLCSSHAQLSPKRNVLINFFLSLKIAVWVADLIKKFMYQICRVFFFFPFLLQLGSLSSV